MKSVCKRVSSGKAKADLARVQGELSAANTRIAEMEKLADELGNVAAGMGAAEAVGSKTSALHPTELGGNGDEKGISEPTRTQADLPPLGTRK